MKFVTVRSEDAIFLHVGVVGDGPDVVVLSGGPGCVNYLENDALAPRGARAWFPEPRGVGRSGGGPHDLAQAITDLETIRAAMGVESWTVLGHSFGSDLAVRYALDHPERMCAVVGVAGHGLHKDRTWSETYAAARHTEDEFAIGRDPGRPRIANAIRCVPAETRSPHRLGGHHAWPIPRLRRRRQHALGWL